MKTRPLVSAEEWESARRELQVEEKELTRARDALAAERRRMPWYTITDDFDADFGVAEALGSTWSSLDMTALGRQEEWEDSPAGSPQTPPYGWWIWHDEPSRAAMQR